MNIKQIAGKVTERTPAGRLAGSVLVGIVAATILVVLDVTIHSRAYLAAHAAPGTITAMLTDGFIGTAIIAGLVAFIGSTVADARHTRRERTAS